MVMERRGNRNPNPISNGKHVKRRRQMSRKTLVRLTIALYMLSSFTAGAIVEFLIDRYAR